MKNKIFNLIILDESGSMTGITRQTIDGCNETLNTIRNSQREFAEKQEHYVSIYAFQGGGSRPSRFIHKNVPVGGARNITEEDYEPDGMTPLLDALGATITDLDAITKKATNDETIAIASVTIITDGAENDSHHYTLQQVAKMILARKELGWNFNFIGANIDVEAAAKALNIDNTMSFMQSDEGTRAMFAREYDSKKAYLSRMDRKLRDAEQQIYCSKAPMSAEERERLFRKGFTEAGEGYYEDGNAPF